MTQLSDKEHKAQMEDMASFDEQMPCVGIYEENIIPIKIAHLAYAFERLNIPSQRD